MNKVYHEARHSPQDLKHKGGPPKLWPVTDNDNTTSKNETEKDGKTLFKI